MNIMPRLKRGLPGYDAKSKKVSCYIAIEYVKDPVQNRNETRTMSLKSLPLNVLHESGKIKIR